MDVEVIAMEGYQPDQGPGFGWPEAGMWVNPSPAIAALNSVRCYAGTVLLEGTHLSEGRGTTTSEGRGTTTPLEVFGAPDLQVHAVLAHMRATAADFCAGCYLRPCFFEPFFNKYTGQICAGVQIHSDFAG